MEDTEKEVSEEKNTTFELGHLNRVQSSLPEVIHQNIALTQQPSNGMNVYHLNIICRGAFVDCSPGHSQCFINTFQI